MSIKNLFKVIKFEFMGLGIVIGSLVNVLSFPRLIIFSIGLGIIVGSLVRKK